MDESMNEVVAGNKMVEAIKRDQTVPGNTLAERVEYALFRSVHSVDALGAVRAEVKGLAGEAMAVKFWQLASRWLNGVTDDAAQKQLFVQEVKRLEPKPEPVKADAAKVDNTPAIPHTGVLSDYLQESFGIGREVAGLKQQP